MKPFPLPALTLGLDVIHPETALPRGAVREAKNIVILDDGTYQRRPGYRALATLEDAHSFWRSPAQTRALVAARHTLYDVALPAGTLAPLVTDLPYEQPVEYVDVGPDIYFTAGGMLRKITAAGQVRRPGVADLLGDVPTLTATVGGLFAGRYGVAYSLVNDLGEESGISSIGWIELADTGGILLSGLQTAPDVVKVKLYITTQNGPELRLHDTRTYAATQTILDQKVGKPADRMSFRPMPGGTIVRLHKGRLYVVDGKWLWISPPLDYGVCDVKSGWMTFNRTITMLEPVDGGIFVGMRERTLFLRGNDPKSFELVPASERGALTHCSTSVKADLLAPALAPSRDRAVAAWMSDVGLAVGRPDGTIVYPQADRISVSGGDARPLFAKQGGIRQGVFCVESLTIGAGGAVDLT